MALLTNLDNTLIYRYICTKYICTETCGWAILITGWKPNFILKVVSSILSLLDLSFANLLKKKGKYLSVMELAFSLADKCQLKQESEALKK